MSSQRPEIEKVINSFRKALAKQGIKADRIIVFGSRAQGTAGENSDIDLVVDIDEEDPIAYSDKYFNLKFHLEKLLNRRIDLLELNAIKNSFLKSQIDKTKVLIYGN